MSEPQATPAPRKEDRSRPRGPVKVEVNISWCKGCGLCVEYCNRDVLEMQGPLVRVVNAAKCSRCLLCEAICPDFAITVLDADPPSEGGGGATR